MSTSRHANVQKNKGLLLQARQHGFNTLYLLTEPENSAACKVHTFLFPSFHFIKVDAVLGFPIKYKEAEIPQAIFHPKENTGFSVYRKQADIREGWSVSTAERLSQQLSFSSPLERCLNSLLDANQTELTACPSGGKEQRKHQKQQMNANVLHLNA